jgi:uncharacterized protein RhaS with RHS repeats
MSTLQNMSYTYDAVGNVTTIVSNPDGILGNADDETQTFGYDTLDRLTSANVSGASINTRLPACRMTTRISTMPMAT